MNTRAQSIGRAPKTKLSIAEYFQRNFVVTTSGVEDPLALRYTIDKLGIDNVLWAIDYPYEEMEPSVKFMNEAPLSAPERAALFHGNAARLFHLPGA